MKLKHTFRGLFIFVVSITGIVFLYRLFMRSKGPLVRIIAFHDVADKKWFTSVLEMLHKNFNVITPDQFHAKEFSSEKINILLTFDDGYQSWIDICAPVLRVHNLKGLFFINSGLLDISSDATQVTKYMESRLFISPKRPLTWDMAKQLVEQGHTIGGHTVSHPNLAVLVQSEVEKEIDSDKKRIETVLDISLTDFAFPFGTKKHFTTETVVEVIKVGYHACYSAITGFCCIEERNKSYPRTLIEKNQDSKQVKRWIEGGYDIFNLINIRI